MSEIFSLSGRISRSTFWFGLVFALIVSIIISYPAGLIVAIITDDPHMENVGKSPIFIAIQLAFVGFYCLLGIKRLHDLGRQFYWIVPYAFGSLFANVLIALDPGEDSALFLVMGFVGLLTTLYTLGLLVWLGFFRGQPDENKFGEPPEGTLQAHGITRLVAAKTAKANATMTLQESEKSP